jgi:hypothetical protein
MNSTLEIERGLSIAGNESISESVGPTTVAGQRSTIVRGYRSSDRKAVRELCCNTGFLGEPIDPIFHDRELFADLLTNAYLDCEPEWALVAEASGRVIGYLLGSVNPRFERVLMKKGFQTSSRMAARFVSGRYASHERSRRFVRWLFTAAFWQRPKHPHGAAHLHFNLDHEYRGQGICRRMWEVYSHRLCDAGITRCYGEFFSYAGRRPERVYARFGFREFDRKHTSFFYPEMSDVELVCVHRNLAADHT